MQFQRVLYCSYCVLVQCTTELGWGFVGWVLRNIGVGRACFAPGQLLAVAFRPTCVVLSVTVALIGDCCLIDPWLHSEGASTALGVNLFLQQQGACF